MREPKYLRISGTAEARLIAGARDTEPVRGLTHGFYKYPARFSPAFVRAAIETFTKPGDLCPRSPCWRRDDACRGLALAA